jgi:hypothetical protein
VKAIILGGGTPSLVMEALAEGCDALGYRPSYGRQMLARAEDVTDFDLVCVWGMASPASKDVVAGRHRQGRPVVIFDMPLLRWVNVPAWDWGDAVGLYRRHVGQAWDVPCSPRRLEAWGVRAKPRAEGASGVLLLGQVPDDAAHGLTMAEYSHWLKDAGAHLREQLGDGGLYYRPHPKASMFPAPLGFEPVSADVPLAEQIQGFAGALTHSSSAQYVCYAEGVPCVVWNREERWPPRTPKDQTVAWQRLAQASWNDWRMAEIRDGTALSVMLEGPPAPEPMAVVDATPKRRRKAA